MADSKIIAVLAVVLIAAAASVYFMFFSASSSADSYRPTLSEGDTVSDAHIDWLAKSVGASNLQLISGGTSEIEVVVKDENRFFTVTLDGGSVSTRGGKASDPDLRLNGDRAVVQRLLGAEDFFSEVRSLIAEDSVTVDVLISEDELDSSGYRNLYSRLSG